MNDRKYTIFSILFLFFLSALIMLRQLKSPDYFSCIIEDSYTYTSWAWQFIQALKEGVIYPRWLPLNFWGYGSPTFILYPPLAFYLVAFFNVFTHSLIAAMNITKLAALVFSGVGMFFLVKEFCVCEFFCVVFSDRALYLQILQKQAVQEHSVWGSLLWRTNPDTPDQRLYVYVRNDGFHNMHVTD
jgi:uncharacterized membrane protein